MTAASERDGPAHNKHVRPALPGSYERLFHDAQMPRFLLPLRTDPELASALSTPRLDAQSGWCSTYRRLNAEVTTSTLDCPSSLILSCTSKRRGPSSRWSGPRSSRPRRCSTTTWRSIPRPQSLPAYTQTRERLFFASNAIYPLAIMPAWLHVIAGNPLSYEVDALRALMLAGGSNSFGLLTDFGVLTSTATLLVLIASRVYPHVVT